MDQRLNYAQAAPVGYGAMEALDDCVMACGLDPLLLELVKMRASQLNGCAYCIDMHSKDARALGESEQRLYALSAWRETPFYSERERAALLWTEDLTLISQSDVPDAVYDEVCRHFSDEELVNLTLVIVTINGWNRLSIAFRSGRGATGRRSSQF